MFSYVDDDLDHPRKAVLVGRAVSWSQIRGMYVWGAQFSVEEIRYMEVEELANAISLGHRLGLNITGSL